MEFLQKILMAVDLTCRICPDDSELLSQPTRIVSQAYTLHIQQIVD